MNKKQLEAMRYVANEKQKAYYRAAEEAERQRLASRSGTSTNRDHNRVVSAIAMLMVNMLDEAIRHAPEEPEALADTMKNCWLEGFYAGQSCPIDGPDAEEIAWRNSPIRAKAEEIGSK